MFLKKKKEKRLENRCKKMAALINVTKLNEQDRKLKHHQSLPVSTNPATAVASKTSKFKLNYNKTYYPQGSSYRKHGNSEKIELDEPPKKPKVYPANLNKEYTKLRQEFRTISSRQKYKSVPRLKLKNVGENARLDSPDVLDEKRIPIFLSDIQDLLLYSVLGHQSPNAPSRWCQIEKCNKISHTVVLVIEGLSVRNFERHKMAFSFINAHLQHRLEIVTPVSFGGSIAEDFAEIPLTGTQKQRLVQIYGSLKAAMQSTGNLVKLLKMTFPICPSGILSSYMIIVFVDCLPKSHIIKLFKNFFESFIPHYRHHNSIYQKFIENDQINIMK